MGGCREPIVCDGRSTGSVFVLELFGQVFFWSSFLAPDSAFAVEVSSFTEEGSAKPDATSHLPVDRVEIQCGSRVIG